MGAATQFKLPLGQLGEEFAPDTDQARATALGLESLDATFRDNHFAPLHSWFPDLEGYSPRFVERVKAEFLPTARKIIEPFAGSGTTPIVLGQAGINCAYSEANPAMAFVIQTKLAALELPRDHRKPLADKLIRLARELGARVAAAEADTTLNNAYASAFGPSEFFDAIPFDQILRLRTVNDSVIQDDPYLGSCFTLAVLASLISTSRLQRAGDLRFKTVKELAKTVSLPVDAVQARLLAQASDLPYPTQLNADVRYVCDRASALQDHLDSAWDGVITSPPYLNGTNYIRNARLELWYLRLLQSKSDLRQLRNGMITAGINDVDAQTVWTPVSPGVEQVVALLTERAYDTRIAKMVGGYFADMTAVLNSLRACVRPSGRLCIDIGDSIYAGVPVRTDDLLVEISEELGFRTIERVHLRKRKSKGGEPLRQQLLVLEVPTRPKRVRLRAPTAAATQQRDAGPSIVRSPSTCRWGAAWKRFKEELPHQQQPFAKREWGGAAHSMCSFQGKMKPALAHHLVACFSQAGDVVLDPFSGAGTIPFEACRMGRKGFGIDISRLGHVLTLAKVSKISRPTTDGLLRDLDFALRTHSVSAEELAGAASVKFNSAIPDYFHPDTLREVLAARAFFLARWDSGPEWALLLACTLHLLHGNRPYALSRRSHPITPFKPTGVAEYRALMPRLHEKLDRISGEITDPRRAFGSSVQSDCTQRWPNVLPRAEAIITSPPFFDSTRFYMTNWMRYWFVGWDRPDFDSQPAEFVETRQKLNLDVYKEFFAAARERVIDRGVLVLHLGESSKCDMGAELATRVDPWFVVADQFTEGVGHCESHGVRDKGTVRGHTYLVLTPR